MAKQKTGNTRADENALPRVESIETLERVTMPTGEIYPDQYKLISRTEPQSTLKGSLWYGSSTELGIAELMPLYPAVQAVMSMTCFPIRHSRVSIRPSDEKNPRAKEWADVMQAHLDSHGRIYDWLSMTLDTKRGHLQSGFAPYFPTWKNVNGFELPDSLEPIEPSWYRSIDYDNNELNCYNWRGQTFAVDMAKLLWLRHGSGGKTNYLGQSFMRSMWPSWFRVIQLKNFEMIQAEHLAGGIYIAEPPDGSALTYNDKGALSSSDAAYVLAQIKKFRTCETSAMVVPPGWKVSVLSTTGGAYDLHTPIMREDKEICTAGLGQLLMLGSDGVGSLALGKELSKLAASGIAAIARELACQISAQLFRRAVLLTEGEDAVEELAPTLVFEGLNPDSAIEMVDVLSRALGTGLISADAELESFVRKQLDAPEKATAALVPVRPSNVTDINSKPTDETPRDNAGETNYAASAGHTRRGHPVERFVDVKLASLALDVHEKTGLKEFKALASRLRGSRAADIKALLAGDKSKFDWHLDAKEKKAVRKIIGQVYDMAHPFGFAEAKRELRRQVTGDLPPAEIDNKRKDELEGVGMRFAAAPSRSNQLGLFNREENERELFVNGFSNKFDLAMGNAYGIATRKALKAASAPDAAVGLEDIEGYLDGTEKPITRAVAAEIGSTAFNGGRDSYFEQFKGDNPEKGLEFFRSAILDQRVCPNCEEKDGLIMASLDDDPVPESTCLSVETGGNLCRCMNIAVIVDTPGGQTPTVEPYGKAGRN
jgi:hypothetical protein